MNIGYQYSAFRDAPVCGDIGAWWDGPQRRVLALADGLGHGVAAHRAASTAMQCIAAHPDSGCAALFTACNTALFDTRGAALAIALIDIDSGMMSFGSIGNIRARVLTPDGDTRLGAQAGFVGAGYVLTAPEHIRLSVGDTLVLFSDGVEESAGVRACLEQVDMTPQRLAEALLDGWGRDSDDAAVLVYRHDDRCEESQPAAGAAP